MNKEYIVESDFVHNGLRCIVIFCVYGYRCGYVGVPIGNRFYGKNYDSVDDILHYANCHGGLTYSSRREESSYPVESNLWWFGFDCVHIYDGKDLELAYKLFPEYRQQIQCEKKFHTMYGKIRDKEYVELNCRNLADQLA